jgi:hemolysin activation/secretion protein
MSFRGAVANQRQFEEKRYRARGDYIFMTAALERNQKLPAGFSLLARVDGQLADQPLITNEQYSAGGVESVRGYHESEATGDNAVHGVVELAAPDLLGAIGNERHRLVPYLFYDVASVWIRDPLPLQSYETNLQGAGIGVRGLLFGMLDYQTDLGFALMKTNRTGYGDALLHFKVRWQF